MLPSTTGPQYDVAMRVQRQDRCGRGDANDALTVAARRSHGAGCHNRSSCMTWCGQQVPPNNVSFSKTVESNQGKGIPAQAAATG
jgi:hypothetical protein